MPLMPSLRIAPEQEAYIRSLAKRHGLSPDAVLFGLLKVVLRAEENALLDSDEGRAEIAAALARSVEDYNAGRWHTLESLQERHEQRQPPTP